MSTSGQIQAIRRTEQRYPADLVHNGHSYRKGYKIQSATIRRLEDYRKERNADRA